MSNNRTFDTSVGTLSGEQLVDLLQYSSYKAQRDIWGMSAEGARRIFPNGAALEARYEREVNAYANVKAFCPGCAAPRISAGACTRCGI
jgi:hypothetical protein